MKMRITIVNIVIAEGAAVAKTTTMIMAAGTGVMAERATATMKMMTTAGAILAIAAMIVTTMMKMTTGAEQDMRIRKMMIAMTKMKMTMARLGVAETVGVAAAIVAVAGVAADVVMIATAGGVRGEDLAA